MERLDLLRYLVSSAAVCMLGAPLLSGCTDEAQKTPAELGRRSAKAAGPPPNIILIITDDQRAGTLNFEGNLQIRTPRLDALAREGAYFSRAYVPTPRCAPSRASLLTGRYPHHHGVIANQSASLQAGSITFPQLLRAQGYACGFVGKWHLGDVSTPQAGFDDYWITYPGNGRYRNPDLWVNGAVVREKGYLTKVLTDYAIEFVEENANRPHLLWLAYKAPHSPYGHPPDSKYRYEAETLSLPESIRDDLSTKPPPQRFGRPHGMYRLTTPRQIRRELSVYYAMISCIDDNVGRLIDRIRSLGLESRTIVVFMSDNGALHGEHQMMRKGSAFYEELVRVPMIMWWPGTIAPSTRINSLVSSLDLFPMLCQLAGAPVPSDLPGRGVLPLLNGERSSNHSELLFEYIYEAIPMRGIVTDRLKYVKYLNDGEELYDLRDDPHEMNNLIAEATRQKQVRMMRRKLEQLRAAAGDHP